MAYRRAFDEIFIAGTIKTVAEIGIENMRTKHVAEYAGFSEATMYRRFPTKEILLRETFLYIDKQVSSILTQSAFIRNPDDTPFELAIYATCRKVYRYLIDHKEETVFLVRYRYSSLYTDEIRSMRQAYNGGFSKVYELFEMRYGLSAHRFYSFLINYIFEMTLCFAEKTLTEDLKTIRTPSTAFGWR
ncbi:MAG: helix-turn-helix transcriptional regulator [Clostridiales bacterium]|nr:helix-turn-helix transcriptional regulator [Candidatus Cacconaster stercorequi]